MRQLFLLWSLVLSCLALSLGCSERRESPLGVTRSAGSAMFTFTDSANPTEEGIDFDLIAQSTLAPKRTIAFAYDCARGETDWTKCKGQFTGMAPMEWRAVGLGYRAVFRVRDALMVGDYEIVAFSEDFGQAVLRHTVVPKGSGGAPCCTEVSGLAVTNSPGSPSAFGTQVTIEAIFNAKPGATSFTSSSVEFWRNGVRVATQPPRETQFGSGKYVATDSWSPTLDAGTYDVEARLIILVGGKPQSWTAKLPAPHVIEPLGTNTSVSGPTSSFVGQNVAFTATLSPIPIGGRVEFFDGNATLPFFSSNVVAFQSTVVGSTNTLGVGAHDIIARYLPSQPANVKDSSGTLRHTVSRPASQLTLSSGANPSVVGQTVTFTAAITCPAGTPTGSVSFDFGDGSPNANVPIPAGNSSAQATHPFSAESAGYNVRASWTGDARCTGSTAPQLSGATPLQIVNKVGASFAVTGPSTATYGETVAFTATLTAGGATPTGSVKFSWVSGASTQSFATVPLAPSPGGASALATIGSLAGQVAPYTILAEYTGDGTYAPVSATTSIAIRPKATTTTVATSKADTSYGEPVTLTATVTRTPGGAGAPTGTVSFYAGSTTGPALPGSPVALGPITGTAALTIASLPVGNHDIVAVFTPAPGQPTLNWAPSQNSVPLAQRVRRATTATTVITSSSPSATGAPVTFTASVAPVAPGAEPTGGNTIASGAAVAVTFKDGTTTLGTGTAGPNSTWTFTTSALTVGAHVITAEYSGNAGFAPSTSAPLTQTVAAGAASVVLTASKAPSAFGETVTFTAGVTKPGGLPTPPGSVVFTDTFEGVTRTLGTVAVGTTGSASLPVPDLGAGTHAIRATYETTSANLAHVVTPVGTATTLTSSINPSTFGQAPALTAKVTSAAGAIPKGSIVFKDNGVAVATVALDAAGVATTSLAALEGGAHTIAAEYGGDANFGPSTDSLEQSVGPAQSKLVLTASANPSRVDANVTFTATMSALAPATAIPSGEVTFKDGTTVLGTSVVGASGTASFTTSSLPEGAHTIEASFAPTANFLASSATLAHTVSQNATAISVTSSPSPSQYGALVTITATLGGATTTPTGSVTFKAGSATLATVPLDAGGRATTTTNALPFGDTLVVAEYGGDANNDPGSATTTHVVEKGPTTTSVASSSNPAPAGTSVAFVATILAGGASISGEVEFLDGTSSIGTVTITGGTATLMTATLSVGSHAITAKYLGNAQLEGSTSAVLTQTIGDAAATPDGGSSATPGPQGSAPPSSNIPPPLSISAPEGSSDDCAMTAGRTSSGAFGASTLLALALLAVRRRRRA